MDIFFEILTLNFFQGFLIVHIKDILERSKLFVYTLSVLVLLENICFEFYRAKCFSGIIFRGFSIVHIKDILKSSNLLV